MSATIKKILGAVVREFLTPPALLIGALLFLWEEVLWVGLGRVMGLLGRVSGVSRIEAALTRLRPYPAVLVFGVPMALVYPAKLVALWLMAIGHFIAGLILMIFLEVLAAAVMARIYTLCRPALRELRWFVPLEAIVLHWSEWAHRQLRRATGGRTFREMTGRARPKADGTT